MLCRCTCETANRSFSVGLRGAALALTGPVVFQLSGPVVWGEEGAAPAMASLVVWAIEGIAYVRQNGCCTAVLPTSVAVGGLGYIRPASCLPLGNNDFSRICIQSFKKVLI
jgi:hypothetical protein